VQERPAFHSQTQTFTHLLLKELALEPRLLAPRAPQPQLVPPRPPP